MRLTEKHMEVRSARRLAIAALCAALGAGTFASALTLRMHVNAAIAGSATGDQPGRITVPAGKMVDLLVKKEPPQYPPMAKKARVQGTVVLRMLIGKDGKVQELHVLSGPKMLTTSALKAVQQWEYKPYLLNGNPVEVETKVNVIYSLGK